MCKFGPKIQNWLFQVKLGSYRLGQVIWNKVEKSNNIEQGYKNVISNSACFLNAIAKV